MRQAFFYGFCPFEIGDKVYWKDNKITKYTVDNILTIHSLKEDRTTFEIIAVSNTGRTIASQNISDFTLIKG